MKVIEYIFLTIDIMTERSWVWSLCSFHRSIPWIIITRSIIAELLKLVFNALNQKLTDFWCYCFRGSKHRNHKDSIVYKNNRKQCIFFYKPQIHWFWKRYKFGVNFNKFIPKSGNEHITIPVMVQKFYKNAFIITNIFKLLSISEDFLVNSSI